MEYRELPRIVAPHDDGDEPGPRPRRFPLARPGRLDLRKVATFAMLAVSLAAVVFYAGRHALGTAMEWLHAQPRYQLPFAKIRLPEPPPECFRGGASAFLERVRRNAKEPEILPLLDVDPARLRTAFKSFPWVAEVGAIERPPGELVVHLKYRRPVAKVGVNVAGQAVRFYLDREGCVLPPDDIDRVSIDGLIWIVGDGLAAPPAERAGTIWKTSAADSAEREALDRDVVQAAKLAGFFLAPEREAEAAETVKVDHITVTAPRSNAGLIVTTKGKAQIRWGRGPGDEEPGELSAAEKWDFLVREARGGLDRTPGGGWWLFDRSRIVYRPPVGGRP